MQWRQKDLSTWVAVNKDNPQYPLDVEGDINCSGTFKINGVPITAFRDRPPIEVRPRSTINGIIGPVNIVEGDNVHIHTIGNVITVSVDRDMTGSSINGMSGNIELLEGDNIVFGVSGNAIMINSDPGEWVGFSPKLTDSKGPVVKCKNHGQYLMYGPACFVQMHLEVEQHIDNPIRVTLPAVSAGTVKQSLSVYGSASVRIHHPIIQDSNLIFDAVPGDPGTYTVSGTYRIA